MPQPHKKQGIKVRKPASKKDQHSGKEKAKQNAAGPKLPKQPSIYEPSRPLSKEALRNAVQQAVNAQIKPTLRQANHGIQELTKERETQLGNQSRQGVQATANVGTYYQQLAAQEAASLAAQKTSGAATTGAVAQSGQDTQAAIAAAGNAAQTGIGAYEGQDIAARDRLTAMIAEQGATAAQQSNALNAQAQGQASGIEGLLAQMAGASQVRGGEQMGDIVRQVQNGLTSTRNEFGKDIGNLRNAKLELLLQRPELAQKALMEFRDKEQTNSLSRAALGLKKEEAKSGVNYSNVNTKNLIKLKKIEQKQRLQEIAAQGASYEELAAIKAQNSKEIIKLQQEGYGKGKGSSTSGAEGYQPFSKTFSYLRNSPVKPKTLATSKKARKAAYDKLRVYGATDKVARQAIKKYVKQYNKKYIKIARDPSPNGMGR